jgi:hypothetical protein
MGLRSCPTWPTASTDNQLADSADLTQKVSTMNDIPSTSRAAALVAPGQVGRRFECQLR